MQFSILECGDEVRRTLRSIVEATVPQSAGYCDLFLNIPIYHIFGKDVTTTSHFANDILPSLLGNPNIKKMMLAEFRGVALTPDKLARILLTGIDVEPATACIYTCTLDKAIEYGGCPNIVMSFDYKSLDQTWRRLSPDASKEEQSRVIDDFPYSRICDDGSLLFSRIQDEHHRFTPYEWHYAHWIPGDARKALMGIFIFDNLLAYDCSRDDWCNHLATLMMPASDGKQQGI